MKKRTGFVSNSSSSSFVLLGFKRDEELEGFEYKGECNGEYYYGKILAYDLEGSSEEVDLKEITEKTKQIAEQYKIDPSEIKLYIDSFEN